MLIMKQTKVFCVILATISIIIVLSFIGLKTISQQENENASESENDDDILIGASAIYRHGDRNIEWTFPTDPYSNETLWPGGFGALTTIGKQQMYDLGQFLRQRYSSILENGRNVKDRIFIRSTNSSRTIESAFHNIAGILSLQPNQISNNTIPIHLTPAHIISPFVLCPRYNNALYNYIHSSEHQNIRTNYESLFQYLEKQTGKSIRTFNSASHLLDTLKIEKSHNKTLPEWANELLLPGSDLNFCDEYYLHGIFTYTAEMARLKIGFLLREILDNFTLKTRTKSDYSLWLYSAHDISIAFMLDALGFKMTSRPAYASCLMFELYKYRQQFYIGLRYKIPTSEHIFMMDIPNCGIKCSLSKFYEIYANIIPNDDYQTECRYNNFKENITEYTLWLLA